MGSHSLLNSFFINHRFWTCSILECAIAFNALSALVVSISFEADTQDPFSGRTNLQTISQNETPGPLLPCTSVSSCCRASEKCVRCRLLLMESPPIGPSASVWFEAIKASTPRRCWSLSCEKLNEPVGLGRTCTL
jgi:hypothetical protein